MNWTTKFEQFSRLKHWRDWKEVAADADRWMMEADEFIKFCTPWVEFVSQVVYIFLLFVPATGETNIPVGCMIVEW